jgi:HEAT repeat protein
LSDPDHSVRESAVEAMGMIGSPTSLEPLKKLVDSTPPCIEQPDGSLHCEAEGSYLHSLAEDAIKGIEELEREWGKQER